MVVFKLKKKIDIGDLGRIYLFTFADGYTDFESRFFSVYFPVKDSKDMIITLKYFEDSINSHGIVGSSSMLFPILSDYIKCMSDIGKDYSSKRIFDNPDDACYILCI